MPAEQNSTKPNFDAAALNEGLMLGLVRQHELIEITETLNEQLQAEIVARKKAEEALVSSEKLASVGRMASVLAHEINNPLEAVTNLLYLVQTTEGLPEAALEYLKLGDMELRRIAHITRQTLGFYEESTSPAIFDVAILLQSVCDLLHAKVVSKQATVERQCTSGLQVVAVEGELRQVLSNLLLNSLDAIAREGRITIRASHVFSLDVRCPCVRFTVSDNGQGIPSTSTHRIFEPFFTTKGSVANGLGLWVGKQIALKHGGILQFRSRTKSPFQGMTFSLILPVRQHEGKSNQVKQSEGA